MIRSPVIWGGLVILAILLALWFSPVSWWV